MQLLGFMHKVGMCPGITWLADSVQLKVNITMWVQWDLPFGFYGNQHHSKTNAQVCVWGVMDTVVMHTHPVRRWQSPDRPMIGWCFHPPSTSLPPLRWHWHVHWRQTTTQQLQTDQVHACSCTNQHTILHKHCTLYVNISVSLVSTMCT